MRPDVVFGISAEQFCAPRNELVYRSTRLACTTGRVRYR
jgi:hypothetical protein